MNRQMPSGDRYTDAPAEIAAEIDAAVPLEDDFPGPEELRRELKRSITIRLDPDVYAWFQLPGPGYQTRINAVLRQYMKLYQKAGTHPSKPVLLARRSNSIAVKGAGKVAAKSAAKAAAKPSAQKSAKKSTFLERVKKARLLKAKKGRTTPASAHHTRR